MTPFLVDIGALSHHACNHALDGLYKAIQEDDHDIWAPHENEYIRDLVEWFTSRGLGRHQGLHDELAGWLAGRYHQPGAVRPRPILSLQRPWSAVESAGVLAYLESAAVFDLEGWNLLCGYLIQKYLPAEALTEEAEWLAVRAHTLGRIQAHGVEAGLLAHLTHAIPTTVAGALRMFAYPEAGEAVLAYGKLRACSLVVALSDSARQQIQAVVLEHMAQRIMGNRPDEGKLQQDLFDKFDYLNRDWRRIALTEAAEMAGQGFISTCPTGSMVRRMEQYHGACSWCKKIDGRLFRVVSPDDENKNGDTDIWVGKTNVGRSSSPRKQTPDGLVDRLPSELYWVAAGTQHPHCRGHWLRMSAPQPGDDPEFALWLRNLLGQKTGV